MDAFALASLINCLTAPNEIVPLAELRRSLAQHPRELVDEALRCMASWENVQLWAEADQKRLTAADRDAALVLGGDPRHCLLISS